MKLRPYQLCRWCDAAVHGRRRWLWLAANVLMLLLSAALGLLWLTLPPLLLANAVLGLYLLHRFYAFGAASGRSHVYQRTPRPQDAQCETVLIDASLIGEGTRLRAAAQPIDVAEGLSLRLGSGALLLGAAMTLTADELPPADRSAILSAVQALNIKPDRMRSHNPVLCHEQEGSVAIVIVQEGMSSRRYYLGSPAEVARCCTTLWEEHTRPLTSHDLTRIDDTARYIAQGNCRVLAWATALGEEEATFLGMAGVGESIHLNALAEVSALRAMGLTVMIDPGAQAETDLSSLLDLLELPDHHARADIHLRPKVEDSPALGVTRVIGESLVEPISTLRTHFQSMETTLRRFAGLLWLPLALSLLFASWPSAVASTALMIYTAIALGVDLTRPLPRRQTLLALGAAALLAKAFLLTQSGSLSLMGGGILTVSLAAGCAVRLCGSAFTCKGESRRRCLPLLAAWGVFVLAAVLCVLAEGTALLLPLGFSALISAVMFLLLHDEHMIFR